MGMYTEFHFNAALKKSTPKNVINILEFMCGQRESQDGLELSHDLFETESQRWQFMLRSDSYSFPFTWHSSVFFESTSECYWINVKSSFKNYEGEIRLFLDWILPFINEDEEDLLGFYRYEENREPTLIYGLVGGMDFKD